MNTEHHHHEAYLVLVDGPVLAIIKMCVSPKLWEEGVSHHSWKWLPLETRLSSHALLTAGSVEGVLVSMVVTLKPDLNVHGVAGLLPAVDPQ